jgi:hypothetical protein
MCALPTSPALEAAGNASCCGLVQPAVADRACRHIAAPGYQKLYKGGTTDNSYVLNTVKLNQTAAELACNDVGGRLASWSTQAEQYEVELFYLSNGYLITNFHKSYWMGLISTPADPTYFTWVDGTPAPGIDRRYAHWGKLRMSDRNAPRIPEPNNVNGDESCAVCNSSMAYGPSWGWADTSCNHTFPAICKIPRTWLRLGSVEAMASGHGCGQACSAAGTR